MRTPPLDKDAIAETLMRTFWTHGFEATSLGRLETATGLKRQSLYNAFGDKAAMFGVALERYGSQIGERLAKLLDRPDPVAAIRDYLDAHVELLSDAATPPGCLIANCSSELGPRDDTLGETMRCGATQSIAALTNTFENWKAAGHLTRSADPATLAALLATLVRGLSVLARSSADPVQLERAVDGAVKAFEPFATSHEKKETER